MSSMAIGIALGGVIFILSLALFISMWNSYIIEYSAAFKSYSNYITYLEKSDLRILNASFSDNVVSIYLSNKGLTNIELDDKGTVLIKCIVNGNVNWVELKNFSNETNLSKRILRPGESIIATFTLSDQHNLTLCQSVLIVIVTSRGVKSTYEYTG